MLNNTTDSLNPSFTYFPVKDQPVVFRIGFGIIAFLSFTANGVLVLFFIKAYREIVKTSYSVFILNLAIADMATGIGLVLMPSLVVGGDSFFVPSGRAGDLYCRVFGTGYVVFTLGVVSSFTITFLAMERWFAVARPAKYKAGFKKSRVAAMLLFVWLCPFIFNSTALFMMTVGPDNKCVWVKGLVMGKTLKQVLGVISFTGMFFIPLLITFVALIKIFLRVRHSQALFITNHGRAGIRLIRMCTVTAVVLAVCWFPNQFSYLLSKFMLIQRDKPFHNFTRMLCMSNSFVNPFIYFATNKSYRQTFLKLVCPCVMKSGVVEPIHIDVQENNLNTNPTTLNIDNNHNQGTRQQLGN